MDDERLEPRCSVCGHRLTPSMDSFVCASTLCAGANRSRANAALDRSGLVPVGRAPCPRCGEELVEFGPSNEAVCPREHLHAEDDRAMRRTLVVWTVVGVVAALAFSAAMVVIF